MTAERRVWRNAEFGRFLGTIFGLGMLGIVVFVSPVDGESMAPIERVVTGGGLLAVGASVVLAVWTSRLELTDGSLSITQFGRTRVIRMQEVESVEPAFWPCTGLIIETSDGRRLRTFVSGAAGDEFWTTRATKICEELEGLAREAR